MKLIKSFTHACQGVFYCLKTQLNFRIHLIAAIAVITASCIFSISKTEWLFVIGCCVAVITAEMINTAIEKLCDMVSKETHPLIKISKDVSAGAVLICAAGSVVIGCIIFLPKIFELI